MDKVFGRFFARFNRLFTQGQRRLLAGRRDDGASARRSRSPSTPGLVALTVFGFYKTPAGFIPQQDKLYLVGIVQLPPAASIDRTDEVVRRMGEIAKAGAGRARLRAVRRRVGQRLRRAVERGAGVLPAQGLR